MDRCDLTDLLVEQCAHCRKPAAVSGPAFLIPSAATGGAGRQIVAQYETTCPECWELVYVGETAVRVDKGWAHIECAE